MAEMMLDQEIRAQRASSWLARVTVADGVFVLVLLLTAVHRLTNLGHLPLSPQEAESALSVWQWWQPGNMTTAIASPAYFSLTSLLTPLAGFSDGVMRLIPALFGVGLVALPWFLRERLGVIGSLVMGLFLAASPLQNVVARMAGGEAIALFALLLTAVAWIRFRDSADKRWFNTLFVALGLGAASAPLFYSGLLTLVIALWLQQVIGPQLVEDNRVNGLERTDWHRAGLIGLGTFLAVSTLFLWNLGGLGAAARILGEWLTQFRIQTELAIMLNPILVFGRYELLLFILGTLLLAWAIWRNEGTAVFAAFWFVALFIIILLQHGQTNNAVLLTLPGYFLIGLLTNALWAGRQEQIAFVLTGGLIFLGALIWVNVARYGRLVNTTPEQLGSFWLALLALFLALAAVYFVGSGWHTNIAWQAMLLSLLVLFFFYQWGTSWWLSHEAANDPRERWVSLPATDDDVRVLTDLLREVSRQATNSDFDLAIFNAVDTPVLRWYLRDYKQAQFGNTIPANAAYEVIINPAEQTELALNSPYLGTDFGLARVSLQPQPGPSAALDALRWWLFHESTTIVNQEQVILWIRSDLTAGGNR
jgi:predicted membrane-bound mannosyltransferase